MKAFCRRLILSHVFLAVLLAVVLFIPKSRPGLAPCTALLAALGLMEGVYLLAVWRAKRKGGSETAPFDIILLVWVILIAWELVTSVFHVAHPVLIPAPENVFHTFVEQWDTLLLNAWYSLGLLLVGFCIGLIVSVIFGLFAGWYPRLRAFASPIALSLIHI